MTLGKNTLYYSSALVFQKILGFIYFALIARFLGVTDTGLYVFALSFTTLFAVFADLGFAPVLIREIAKGRERAQELFSQVLSVKIIISAAAYLLVVFFVNLLGYPELTKTLVYIAGGVMVLDSFSLIFWAVFRGYQNLLYEAWGVVGFQIVTVGLGLGALFLGLGVRALIVATLIGSAFYFLFSLGWLLKKLALKLKLVFDRKTIVWIFKLSLPFALAGVFARIYTQIDTVMLSKMACDAATQYMCDQYVGWYGVASKVVLALQFIPMAFAASLFPVLSEQGVDNPEKLRSTYFASWRYLALIGIPLAFGVIALAPEVVMAVWGEDFLPSVLPLQILMGSLIFLFLTFPNGSLLNALGHQARNTVYMGVVVVVNVVLNSIMIPTMQMTGAAIASVCSTFLLFVLGFIFSRKLVSFGVLKVFGELIKIILSASVMFMVILLLKTVIGWGILVGIGAGVYVIIGFILGSITKNDIQIFLSLVKKQANNVSRVKR